MLKKIFSPFRVSFFRSTFDLSFARFGKSSIVQKLGLRKDWIPYLVWIEPRANNTKGRSASTQRNNVVRSPASRNAFMNDIKLYICCQHLQAARNPVITWTIVCTESRCQKCLATGSTNKPLKNIINYLKSHYLFLFSQDVQNMNIFSNNSFSSNCRSTILV